MRPSAFAALVLAGATLSPAGSLPAAGPLPGPEVAYSRAPETVVLEYRRVIAELVGNPASPHLLVHGDGRVEVRYPEGHRRAGSHELRLRPEELDVLLVELLGTRLLQIDEPMLRARREEVLAERRQLARGGGLPEELFWVADADRTLIELRFDRYWHPGLAGTYHDVERRFEWEALAFEAAKLPELPDLAELARLEARLLDLAERVAPLEEVE
jgi:hypothetical protein